MEFNKTESESSNDELYQTLVENFPQCILEIDINEQIKSINQAGLTLLKCDGELEPLGRSYLENVDSKDRDRIRNVIRSSFDGNVMHCQFNTPDERVFECSFIPIRDRFAKVTRMVSILSDKIEQILKNDKRGMEQVLDRVDRSILRCDKIIEELLDFTGTTVLKREEIKVDTWIEDLVAEYNLPDDITASMKLEPDLCVLADQERLHRCFVNLIDNACQAFDEDSKHENSRNSKVISIDAAERADRIEIQIRNNGIGISSNNLERIFEPLYSTKSFGFGLGLPIVKQIIEDHGENLGISSIEGEGEGTTVTLNLPNNNQ